MRDYQNGRELETLLEHGSYQLTGEQRTKRKATLVYSGGGDLFVIGQWADIVGFAVDLHHALKRFSQGTLTISGGLQMYPLKYPITLMAQETGELEERAKALPGKNGQGEDRYRMMGLMQKLLINSGEATSAALYERMLAQLRLKTKEPAAAKAYEEFSQKMSAWFKDPKHCRQLVTAVNLYKYTLI